MPYTENLKIAEQLKTQLDEFRPLPPETEQRIMQKFRLDWNYHSSNIEGNKLTYGETKALLLFGVTAQAKPMHDHLEMQGHDEGIKWLEEIIRENRPLNETFICQLHELILKESYEVPAQTPDGKKTTRKITLGKYKSVPNHVLTQTGEMFYFATPEETPAKMGELMDWLNTQSAKDDVNPVLLAIEFHYRFIRIHPFDDGNGRMARLLMNFVLMKNGYPPAIVKTEDKENYYAALQQADAGDIAYFFDYITSLVNHSLELMIKGAKGESIEEDDDLDKQLALLKQEIDAEDEANEIKQKLNVQAVKNTFENWGYVLLEKLAETTIKFNGFYDSPKHHISMHLRNLNASTPYVYFTEHLNLNPIKEFWGKEDVKPETELHEADFRFSCHFGGFKKGGLNPFGCNYSIEVKYTTYNYEVIVDVFDVKQNGRKQQSFAQRLLHQALTNDEINAINKSWGETLLQHLNTNRAKLKNGK